jgi:predicted nucleotidyltransferase
MRLQAPAAESPFPQGPNLGNFECVITMGTLMERREQIRRLAERYRTGNVRVFGSVARGDNTGASDVDLLVTPRAGCSLFDLGGLLEDLQELLGCRVDLVTEDGLRARLRDRVLREAVPL